jgi:myosin heavy subunit
LRNKIYRDALKLATDLQGEETAKHPEGIRIDPQSIVDGLEERRRSGDKRLKQKREGILDTLEGIVESTKGTSSESSESAVSREEYTKTASEFIEQNRPPKISQRDLDKMTDKQRAEELRKNQAYLESARRMATRDAPSIRDLRSKEAAAEEAYERVRDAYDRGESSEEAFNEARTRMDEARKARRSHQSDLEDLYGLERAQEEVRRLQREIDAASQKSKRNERRASQARARRAEKKREQERRAEEDRKEKLIRERGYPELLEYERLDYILDEASLDDLKRELKEYDKLLDEKEDELKEAGLWQRYMFDRSTIRNLIRDKET